MWKCVAVFGFNNKELCDLTMKNYSYLSTKTKYLSFRDL